MLYNRLEEQASESLDALQTDQQFLESVERIVSGRFARNANSPEYEARLIYTKNLRFFLSNKEVFNAILINEKLKQRFFRVFGYQNNLDFTLYPDCWIRDLPLLNIGKGVYLGDGIILGTNRISPDQKTIDVGGITIGDGSIFDQRCAVGGGSTIGRNTQFGFNVVCSSKCKIGNNVNFGAETSLSHCVTVEDNVIVEPDCKIGQFVKIKEGAIIKEFSKIPSFSTVYADGRIETRKRSFRD